MANLIGEKEWSFYPLPDDNFEKSSILGYNAYRDAFEIESLGSERPLLWKYATKHRVRVRLKPGELLFVPGGLPHTVENLTPTMAISTNYVDASNMDRLVKSISREWKEVRDGSLQAALPSKALTEGTIKTCHSKDPRDTQWETMRDAAQSETGCVACGAPQEGGAVPGTCGLKCDPAY